MDREIKELILRALQRLDFETVEVGLIIDDLDKTRRVISTGVLRAQNLERMGDFTKYFNVLMSKSNFDTLPAIPATFELYGMLMNELHRFIDEGDGANHPDRIEATKKAKECLEQLSSDMNKRIFPSLNATTLEL